VCVVDATQLVRNLYLVLQLIELGLPVVVALNMSDRSSDGQTVDAARARGELGVPCVRSPRQDQAEELRARWRACSCGAAARPARLALEPDRSAARPT
jgi:ferrous iron transport protein B